MPGTGASSLRFDQAVALEERGDGAPGGPAIERVTPPEVIRLIWYFSQRELKL
jgi:hypothetical protein